MRACVRASKRACVLACVRACVRACVCERERERERETDRETETDRQKETWRDRRNRKMLMGPMTFLLSCRYRKKALGSVCAGKAAVTLPGPPTDGTPRERSARRESNPSMQEAFNVCQWDWSSDPHRLQLSPLTCGKHHCSKLIL